MAYQSDEDIASMTTPSTPKKPQSQPQSPAELQEMLLKHWPFTRADPTLLERAHKHALAQEKATTLAQAEPAPY